MQTDGHLFVELYVEDVAHHRAIFEGALGFEVVDDDDGFVKLARGHATVMLNRGEDLPEGHPFAGFRGRPGRGLGVEMGFVTTDLDSARKAALAIPGCTVTEVTHQEWGMSDFRILSREGYFLRVTTPDPGAG